MIRKNNSHEPAEAVDPFFASEGSKNCREKTSEFDWIHRYFAPLAHPDALQLSDDAALLRAAVGGALVLTTDTLNEKVHFFPGTDPALIARKALRTNLSDLAAMGATPYGYSLNLSLQHDTNEAFIAAFASGLEQDQARYDIALLGGDTTATYGSLSVTITALGHCYTAPMRRSGAKPGDTLYVTGTIGLAYLGLQALLGNQPASEAAMTRYHLPEPRVAAGIALAPLTSAALDISDGLLQDAQHLARASGVACCLSLGAIPLADPQHDRLAQLAGGDDYELLFTAPPAHAQAIEQLAARCEVAITAIGTVEAGEGVRLQDAEGKDVAWSRGGFSHF